MLFFAGLTQGLVLNVTNLDVLLEAFGSDEDAWIGRKIALDKVRASFGGRSVNAIRVRVPSGASAAPARTHPAPAAAPDAIEVPLPDDPAWEVADAE